VVASGLIGDPGLEVGLGTVCGIVLVILAVVPVVPHLRRAVRGLPPVDDMDVVVLLAVEPLRFVLRIVLTTQVIVTDLLLALVLDAIRFTVLEVTIWVVVLGVLVPVMRTALVGEDRRTCKHHRRQQPQKQHQSSQLFLLPKASPYSISRRLKLRTSLPHKGGALSTRHHRRSTTRLPLS
jgi:hypothetical protein